MASSKAETTYLLLEDVDGSKFEPLPADKTSKPITLVRGDILFKDPRNRQSNGNWVVRSQRAPDCYAICSPESLGKLTNRQLGLLLSLQSASDRYETYHNGHLFDAEDNYKENLKVIVETPNNPEPLPGVIWFAGNVESIGKGILFGVELLVHPPRGNVDGSLHGKSYFSCPPNCGVFVSFDKLKPCYVETEFAAIVMEACMGSNDKLHSLNERLSKRHVQTRSQSVRERQHTETDHRLRNQGDIGLGTPVVFFSDTNKALHGIVRWLGEAYFHAEGKRKPELMKIVGIEAEDRHSFMYGLKGIDSQSHTKFTCVNNGHKIYLPVDSVISKKNYRSAETEKTSSRSRAIFPPKDEKPSSGNARQSATDFTRKQKIKETSTAGYKQSSNSEEPRKQKEAELPVGIKGSLTTSEFLAEQEKLLAEAKAKPKGGSQQPTGIASGIAISKDMPSSSKNQVGHKQFVNRQSLPESASVSNQRDVQQHTPWSNNQSAVSRTDVSHPQTHSVSYQSDHHGASSKGSAVGKHHSDFYDSSLDIGSAVEVKMEGGVILYGTIRWIGELRSMKSAGIELDDKHRQARDGLYEGMQYFQCQEGYGWFCPLSHCKKDQRFVETSPIGERLADSDMSATMRLDAAQLKGKVGGFGPQPGDFIVGESTYAHRLSPVSVGEWKGIQGHHNSCYLDATLFSMFYTTYVFDSIFNRMKAHGQNQKIYEELRHILKHGIVNPLRKHSFVRADLVMNLRKKLEKLGGITGFTHQEKDPEEFLNSLLQEVFKVPSYLRLKSGGNVQEMYFYQLFVTKEPATMAIPTVQHLVEQSFLMSDLKFAEVPAVFLVQMPRFGKKFKLFEKIIPSPKLKITNLLQTCDRHCALCNQEAVVECQSCSKESLPVPRTSYIVSLCKRCDEVVHSHPDRKEHNLKAIKKSRAKYEDEELELFAVICIETSHYVSFVKFEDGNWCFFDSMADRIGGEDGYNVPRVVKCDDLNDWLQNPEKVRDKENVIADPIRRLFSDAYMCMYVAPERSLYERPDDDK